MSIFRKVFVILLVSCFLTVASFTAALAAPAKVKEPDVVIEAVPEQVLTGYLADEEFVLAEWSARGLPGDRVIPRVKPGQIVRINTVYAGGLTQGDQKQNEEFFKARGVDPKSAIARDIVNVLNSYPLSLADKEIVQNFKVLPASGHKLTGPLYIEGAEPGDVLEIRILDLDLSTPYGICTQRPGAGAIPDDVKAPYAKVIDIDLEKNMVLFDDNIQFPVRPFMGIMGVAPADGYSEGYAGGVVKTVPPGNYGGNIDCNDLTIGSTLYIPVHQEGALFYTGDAHAIQGDGEVTINALETSIAGTFQFVLHKKVLLTGYLENLERPFAETSDEYIVIGLGIRDGKDLNSAMQDAVRETIKFLQAEKGMTWQEAFTLASVKIDFEVTQAVDSTLGIHAIIPKDIFIH